MKTALRIFAVIAWIGGGAVGGALAARVPQLDMSTLQIVRTFRPEVAACTWLAAAACGLMLYAAAEILERQEKNSAKLDELQKFADFILDTNFPDN